MVISLYPNGSGRSNNQTRNFNHRFLNPLPHLPNSALFGTDGIRGKAGELLTAPFALQLAFYAGQVLKSKTTTPGPIIIGQDSRNSSDMLAMAMAAGLTSVGLEVWQLGLCPTPCVAYLTRHSEAMAGIMISASHNPPEDNGIKFFNADGTKLSSTLAQEIEEGLRGNLVVSMDDMGVWGKTLYQSSLVNDYCQFLQDSLPTSFSCQGMKIVLDLAWGASVNVAPAMFKALGAEVICLHDTANGDRINVNCGSTNLNLLQAAIAEHQADMGFAFDGDADRVMAVDGTGKVVDGDYILYLWGKYLLERGKLPDNLLIGTVMANLGFERAWQGLGGQLVRTSVGDRHVQAQMWQTGAMLGGEQSGHIICHHYGVSGDGVQTALQLAALVHESGVSLAELVQNSFETYPQILRNVRLEDREKLRSWQQCEPLQQAIAQAGEDMGNTGRVLVRASGTEPLIRVMVESECPNAASHWVNYLVGVVETHLAA
ncbi:MULTISPECIES: phosphoglucosamine mutase [Crocosphaera]|uniref:Phosphoglucosamine mutase n=3 Tax=Crocosphaera watsonii TaxID=263511 RepID=T2JV44_CROWT|nr:MULTISPECIES: phosphoglucosamine mutase [Crocosphaera]EHJ13053.1 Phosphoglucosamine mutase [Crocosphaera watsonii WH 0003]MCH2247816.1 phosphoglucosamine mutase [Crocosphaera sp.]CCQ54744.1 Phosphoglucosamine mutase [Crocosphaera watsonii WH 0005]CCQ69693.1 Phosphoglucosamine mutase [Crocosphaera watsonii WH 0402]